MATTIDEKKVMDALGTVKDPELGAPLMRLNMIREVRIQGDAVSFKIVLTTPACPLKAQIEGDARKALEAVPGIGRVDISFGAEVMRAATPPQGPAVPSNALPGVRNILAVGSGKGGVGKSTVSVNIAVALARMGAKVGLLDADVYGPSVPHLTSVKTCAIEADGKTMIPAENFGIKIVSMGFFLKDQDPVIWRGPMLHGIMQKFLNEVRWGELDYLIIDLPPGTGDVQLSLSQMAPVTGAVAVTTPQDVALLDVRRAIAMFGKVRIPVLGVVENMSAFECPHCRQSTKIFGEGAGEKIQKEFGVPLLGRVPLNKAVMDSGEVGQPLVAAGGKDAASQALVSVAQQLAAAVSVMHYRRPGQAKIEM